MTKLTIVYRDLENPRREEVALYSTDDIEALDFWTSTKGEGMSARDQAIRDISAMLRESPWWLTIGVMKALGFDKPKTAANQPIEILDSDAGRQPYNTDFRFRWSPRYNVYRALGSRELLGMVSLSPSFTNWVWFTEDGRTGNENTLDMAKIALRNAIGERWPLETT